MKAAIFDILINFEIYKSRIPLQSAAEHPNAATLPKRMLRQAATQAGALQELPCRRK